jgi:hypothetical protein
MIENMSLTFVKVFTIITKALLLDPLKMILGKLKIEKFNPKPVKVAKASYLKYCDNTKPTKATKLSYKRHSNVTKNETKEHNKSMSKTEMNFISLAKDAKNYESQIVSKNHSKSPIELSINNNKR